MNVLQVKKRLPFNQGQIIQQAKFSYFPLWTDYEKQTEKNVGAYTSLILSNKKDELKQIEGIFLQNLINALISAKRKEIVHLIYKLQKSKSKLQQEIYE